MELATCVAAAFAIHLSIPAIHSSVLFICTRSYLHVFPSAVVLVQ